MILNKKIPPCKECKDRKIGCHGKCERYRQFREELDELNKTIKNAKQYGSIARQQIQAAKRYNGRNGFPNNSYSIKIHRKSMGKD